MVPHIRPILWLVVILFATVFEAFAQQSGERGIQLYLEGKLDAAIAVLETSTKEKGNSKNAGVWNILGLAYYAKDDMKGAKRAFETAVRIDPNLAAYHGNLATVLLAIGKLRDARSESDKTLRLDPKNTNALYILGRLSLWEGKLEDAEQNALRILALAPESPDGYILRSNVLMARLGKFVGSGWDVKDELELLKEAADVLNIGAKKSQKHPDNSFIVDQAESVSAFYDYFAKDRTMAGSKAPTDDVRPLKITKKSPASYTSRARSAGVQGTIRMAVLFGANGRVKYALLLRGLGYGLDEAAAQAARSIEFIPQTVAGKPVSVVKMVEYTFSIF